VNDIRGYARDGFVLDETQIEQQFGSTEAYATFNRVRGWVDLGRSNLYLLIVLLAVVALATGFLGGRRLGSRVLWAGVPVLVSGLIAAIAFGPVSEYGFDTVDEWIGNIDIPEVFAAKLLDVRVAMERAFVEPMALQSMVAAGIGAALVFTGAVLSPGRSLHRPRRGRLIGQWQARVGQGVQGIGDGLRSES
jgi:hypothetical protein